MRLLPPLLLFLAASPAAATIEWRLAHYLPGDHFFAAGWLADWAARLERESEGRLRIVVRPNNELLRLGAIAPGVAEGKAEMGFGPAPEAAVLSVLGLPFMVDSATQGTGVAMRLLAEGDLAGATRGLHVVYLQTNAPSLIHTRGRPVRTPADLEGLGIRGATEGIRELISAIGGTPVAGFLAPQVYGALRDGQVDGTVFPYEALGVFRLGEQLDYHTEVFLFVAALGLFVNAEALAALPADLRALVMRHSGPAVALSAAAAWDAEETRGREIALELGNTVIRPDEAELSLWREAAAIETQARLGKLGDEAPALLKRVTGIINAAGDEGRGRDRPGLSQGTRAMPMPGIASQDFPAMTRAGSWGWRLGWLQGFVARAQEGR
jgi:TRAP-type C4-dicarboxylate transport system substrate-binding protein